MMENLTVHSGDLERDRIYCGLVIPFENQDVEGGSIRDLGYELDGGAIDTRIGPVPQNHGPKSATQIDCVCYFSGGTLCLLG